MGQGESYEIFIRAQGLTIRRSDGQAFSLDQFGAAQATADQHADDRAIALGTQAVTVEAAQQC